MSVEERNIKSADEVVLNCKNLVKTFPSHKGGTDLILDDISIEIRKNEFVVLLGPGQCGKTTLLNIFAGLSAQTGGDVSCEGAPIEGPSTDRGMVFQEMGLFPWKTVMGNVTMGPRLNGVEKKEREKIAQDCINLVGLTGFEKAYPHQLSGGMKQRVGIARAYANNPKIMLMDEPFGHLDAQTRYQMQGEILKIWQNHKRTIVFVTNNLEEAVFLGDRIILLSKCPATVKEEYVVGLPHPRNQTAASFMELRQRIAEQMDIDI
ncbi:MAG: ABC transporter ATP-binding protein [Negativicutes bacterium]|nr:ABC transporter ATP-binding protein [Negativicutes bacterium]